MTESSHDENIELLTYSEIVEVKGFVGNFDVTIRKKPRYVDMTKCTGCGLCFPKCPVILKSEFNLNLSDRRAVYIPFPQAVPNKAVIDKREERPCKAACIDTCPIHTNVLGYVKLIAEGKFKEAYQLIRDTNPLPSVCDRVCYAPCEETCNRAQMDEPIAIRDLKRFADDQVDIDELEVPQITKTGKRIAIIGAGPAGLAAAHDLALEGHEVTIFEALPEPGGMLRYGIPEYRLPKEILGKEIHYIQRLGVKIKTGVQVGKDISLTEIRGDHQAVFIATGAHGGMRLGIEGEDLPGVLEGIRFLRSINLGEKVDIGKKVAVIGGGNTAIDCARTAKRLRGEDVRIVYRRSRNEMPASLEEIEAAQKEGIEIVYLAAPIHFLSEDGRLSEMVCIKMKLGQPDASGRPTPVPVQGSEFILSVDTVIVALGQVPETEFVRELGLSLNQRGAMEVDHQTYATSKEGIYAGGDVVTGPANVVDAIAAGKKVARSISRYLRGESPRVEGEEKRPERLSEEELAVLKNRFSCKKRVKMEEEPVEERVGDFREVALGFKTEEAIEEASRCLAGQIEGCIECRECEKYCDPKAIDYDQKEEIITKKFGAIIVATGFTQFDYKVYGEYGAGRFKDVITGLHLERMLDTAGPTGGYVIRPSNYKEAKNIVFIQCVGSRDESKGHPYCSRICCMYTAKQAILLKDHFPESQSYIFYIDIRAGGKNYEEFVKRAQREYGAIYIRGRVSKIYEKGEKLIVRGVDTLAGKQVEIEADLVVLATAVVPQLDAVELAKILNIPYDQYGFYSEAHPKLQPVESVTKGIFLTGSCQFPKDIPDSVATTGAASVRACEILSKDELILDPKVAFVDSEICSGCLNCLEVCPFDAIETKEVDGRVVAQVISTLCHGCGNCAATCRTKAANVQGFTDDQIYAQIASVFEVLKKERRLELSE